MHPFPGPSQSEHGVGWRAKWSDLDLEEKVKINNVFDMFFTWFLMALRDVISMVRLHLCLCLYLCLKTLIFTVARPLSTNINDDVAQSRLRLVFEKSHERRPAPHTSASRRKVEERLQSATLTAAHFSSYQGGL